MELGLYVGHKGTASIDLGSKLTWYSQNQRHEKGYRITHD